VLLFSLNSRNFLFPLLFLWWPTDHEVMCCSVSRCLNIFCCFFCSWVLVLFQCGQMVCGRLFQFSYMCSDLLCDLKYDLFWRKFLRRMYTVLLQDRILCRCLSGQFDLWCHLILRFFVDFFLPEWLVYSDRGVLKSPTITMLGSICVFNSNSICLMKLSAQILGTCKLTIVISSWDIVPFINMKWTSLSLLIN
jgi:hypothetical protein